MVSQFDEILEALKRQYNPELLVDTEINEKDRLVLIAKIEFIREIEGIIYDKVTK